MDKWEKYRLFIGKNADYYIPKFKKFEETGGALSWNWAAFFLGVIWMFYRKMYVYGIVVFFFSMLLGVMIAAFSPNNILLSVGLQVWLWIGFGAFGNYIYYIFVKNSVSRLESLYPDTEALKAALVKEGGVSLTGPVVFLLIIFILQLLLYGRQ